MLDEEVWSEEIGADGAFELGEWLVDDLLTVANGGVVDEDVDLAECRVVLLEDAIDIARIADVSLHDERFASKCLAGFGGLLSTIPIRVIANGYIRAGFGQAESDSAADSAIRPGDQGYVAIDSQIHVRPFRVRSCLPGIVHEIAARKQCGWYHLMRIGE